MKNSGNVFSVKKMIKERVFSKSKTVFVQNVIYNLENGESLF